MFSDQYDWSYIRSELNSNDIDVIDDRLLFLYNSIIVEYDFDGSETGRYDLKTEFNIGHVQNFEVDIYKNIWLFGKEGTIIVLDSQFQLIKDFSYLDIDKSSECIDVVIDSGQHFLCTYIEQSNLGILNFSYNAQNKPIYLDYYVLEQGVIPDEIFVDLDIDDQSIYLSSSAGVYYADKESDLKQSESWQLYSDNLSLSSVSLSDIFIFSKSSDNTIDIFDIAGSLIQNLPYAVEEYVDIINIEDNLVGLVLSEQIIILSYNIDLNQFIVEDTYSFDLGLCTQSVFKDSRLFASILNQGFQIIQFDGDRINVIRDTPSINKYTSIELLSDRGLIASGISVNSNDSYASTLHYNTENYYNYIPTDNLDSYYLESEFNAIPIDYKVGNFSPLSIIELDDGNVMFSNSGLYLNSDQSGGVIEINLDDQELVNIFSSDNTLSLGGLNGVYNSSWTSNYTLVNQIVENNGIVYVVNPYNELYGKIISSYSPATGQWNGLDVSGQALYLPREITFDYNGQMWIVFDRENDLSGSELYSSGGIRYVNSNNQVVEPGNSSEIVGGANVDALSLDVCRYNGFDILWILTTAGLQGYTIHQNQLSAISSSDYFIESQFSNGDKVRCDELSNVWITTRHSGVRVVLSASGYTEFWPSYLGFRANDSGLLSDIVYDIDFDTDNGHIYFATDLGISILESPLYEPPSKQKGKYEIKFSQNPFLTPKDNNITISNFPVGSTIKIMNLKGRVLHTMKNPNLSEYTWDGKDNNGDYINSGVYIVTSSHPNKQNGIGKLAIVRER